VVKKVVSTSVLLVMTGLSGVLLEASPADEVEGMPVSEGELGESVKVVSGLVGVLLSDEGTSVGENDTSSEALEVDSGLVRMLINVIEIMLLVGKTGMMEDTSELEEGVDSMGEDLVGTEMSDSVSEVEEAMTGDASVELGISVLLEGKAVSVDRLTEEDDVSLGIMSSEVAVGRLVESGGLSVSEALEDVSLMVEEAWP
jgi:hypothetical protein